MSDIKDFVIENGVLKEYKGVGGDVVIPEGVVQIGRGAFANNAALISVVFPSFVKRIEGEAFYRCKALIRAELPGVEEIGSGAFCGCEKLEELMLSNELRTIDSGAFCECSSLTYVSLPENLVQIGWRAFRDCSIKRIVIPKSVKVLHREAFSGCPDITVYDTIDPDATNCNDKIDLINGHPNSELGAVGTGWRHSGRLRHSGYRSWIDHVITVRSAETDTIKYKVYMEADSGQRNYQCLLTSAWGHNATFSFEALDEFFPKIKKKKPQVALSRLTYRTALSPEMEGKYKKYICKMANDVLLYCIEQNDMNALALCADIGAIKANNIEELLSYATQKGFSEVAAFLLDYQNKHIAPMPLNLSLSASKPITTKSSSNKKVWTIIKQTDGTGLISKYTGEDTDIEFPTEVDGIKIYGTATRRGETPDNYKKITSVTIPEGYVVIGNKTFEGCKSLKSIDLAATIEEIGNEAFAGCTALETVVIPPLVRCLDAFSTNGGKYAFRDCGSLKDIFLMCPYMYISGSDIFKGCKEYHIHAVPNASVFQSSVGKFCDVLRQEEIKSIAKLYYGTPRKRTVVCTENSEELPETGNILHLEEREVIRKIYGSNVPTTEFHVVNNLGVAFGSPMMNKFDLYGDINFVEDMAIRVFLDYLVAQVTSPPRKYKKYKCFDVEIKFAD